MRCFMRFRLRRQRLESEIRAYKEEFTKRIMQIDEETRASWEKLLELAEDARTINEGYHLFHSAYRLGLKALTQDQLKAEAKKLKNEAEYKLSSWRKKAAIELLKDPIKIDFLVEAMKIRDEHFDNIYFTNDLIKRQIFYWVLNFTCVLIAIFAFIIVQSNQELPIGKIENHGSIDILIPVFLFGTLGGIIFAFFSTTRKTDGHPRIPEQLLTGYVTLSRPVWGGVGALVVYLVLQAGIIKIVVSDNTEGALILSMSIAAGYTERLATGALEKVAKLMGKDKDKAKSNR